MKSCLILLEPGTLLQHQVEPLMASARTLARHGWSLQCKLSPNADAKLAVLDQWLRTSRNPAAVMVQIDWRYKSDEAAKLLEQLRQRLEAASKTPRLVFWDHYDGVGSPHLSVLPHVDTYLKKQLPRDLSLLAIGPDTGGALAERVRALYEPEHAPANPDETVLDLLKTQSQKLLAGWNLGAANYIQARLFRRRWLPGAVLTPRFVTPQADRTNDLHCRVGLGDHGIEDWYRRHRRAVLASLEALPGRYSRILGAFGGELGPSIPTRRYRQELANTRICVSPFGYGEVCYRDYEAVAAGCVLAKPDMSHVRTEPDIYIPHETYIPFRLDLSDLHEALQPYLADPARCAALAEAARARLADYFRSQPWTRPFLEACEGPQSAWIGA